MIKVKNTSKSGTIFFINKENEKLESLISSGPIPATVENVRLLLNFLNEQNWGSWVLPKMSIGYSAKQYDCEGCTATTITLDSNISDDFVSGNKFKVGGKNGHLTQYISL